MTKSEGMTKDEIRTPKAFASRGLREQETKGAAWVWLVAKNGKTPEFGKFFEIFRKKAKFPERRGRNSSKLIEIDRNFSKPEAGVF